MLELTIRIVLLKNSAAIWSMLHFSINLSTKLVVFLILAVEPLSIVKYSALINQLKHVIPAWEPVVIFIKNGVAIWSVVHFSIIISASVLISVIFSSAKSLATAFCNEHIN